MDVVEVSPPHDHAEITSFLANRVALEALSGIARRRRDARDGTTWDRCQPLLAARSAEKFLDEEDPPKLRWRAEFSRG